MKPLEGPLRVAGGALGLKLQASYCFFAAILAIGPVLYS